MTDFVMTLKIQVVGDDMDQAIDRLQAWFKMANNSVHLSEYIVDCRLLRCDMIQDKKKKK